MAAGAASENDDSSFGPGPLELPVFHDEARSGMIPARLTFLDTRENAPLQ